MAEQMDPRVMKMMLDMKRKQDMNSQMMPSVSRTGMGAGLSGGLNSTGMKKGGLAKFEKSGKDKEYGMKEGSKKDMMMDKKQMMGMNKGGMPMVMKDGKKVPSFAADGKGKMAHGGMAKKMMGGGMAYAKGGSASSRADGIAQKGKTKGKMLNKGGKIC